MKVALSIVSYFAVVVGTLAVIGGLLSTDANGSAMVDPYAILGGGMFLTQGILSLVYMGKYKVRSEG